MNLWRHYRRNDAWKKESSRSRLKRTSVPRSWVAVTIILLLVFGACTTFASPISSSSPPSTELSSAHHPSSFATATTTESVAELSEPEKMLLAALSAYSTPSEPVPQPTSTDLASSLDIPPFDLNALPIVLASSPSSASPSLSSPSPSPSNSAAGPITGGGSAGDDANGPLILNVGQKTRITSVNVALGVIFLILGLVQTFYGFKFIRLTLLLMGFLSCAVIAILIMLTLNWQLDYYVFRPSHYVFWVWFLVGLVGAVVCFRFWDLGVTFAGAFGGFAIAVAIVAITDRHISTTWRYILLVALVIICAALATLFERVAVVLCTSFGGSYMFMYGLDGFLQVGYREMIVIFQFTGRTLTYHPNTKVFWMIGGWFALALLGIAWEFWHHETPILMDRKAIFRIYGRPFGKRPKKLVGQRLTGHVQSRDWFVYLTECVCLRRNTVKDVLNQPMDDDFVVVVGVEASMEGKEQDAGNQQGQQSSSISTVQGSDIVSSELGEQLADETGSSLSSKTVSCHETEDPDEKQQDLGHSSVQVVIEETDYQVKGEGEAPVVLGMHTESAVSTTTSSSSSTEKSTTVTRIEHASSSFSNSIAGQHVQESSKTLTSASSSTAVSSAATRVVSTSSNSTSTSSRALETVADRPSLSIVQENHHHSTSSMTTARSVVHSSSTTTTTTTRSQTASGTTTTIVDSTTTPST